MQNKQPQIGDVIEIGHFWAFKDFGKNEITISSVNYDNAALWAENDTMGYFFEDLDDTGIPNRWRLNWE